MKTTKTTLEWCETLIKKGGFVSFFSMGIELKKDFGDDVTIKVLKTVLLNEFLGKQVILDCRSKSFLANQKPFENCIRVSGTLEENKGQYRVVFSNGNYSYFDTDNVVEFGSYGAEKTFTCGSLCLFGLRF